MTPKSEKFDVDKLRVASPCSAPWEGMIGDGRVRRCDSCEQDIYNTPEMTASEIEEMIRDREGRLCVRLYRRADGTVMTKDCAVGVRAYRKYFARLAGACFASIIGLVSISYGQTRTTSFENTKTSVQKAPYTELNGTVVDPLGAVVPGADVLLLDDGSKIPYTAVSDENGNFRFNVIDPDKYRLKVSATGFETTVISKVKIGHREKQTWRITLKPTGKLIEDTVRSESGLGALYGSIADPNGAVIPGALLVLRRKGNKIVASQRSDGAGKYRFLNLASGTYELEVTASGGFGKSIVQNIELASDQTREIAITMNVVAETVGMLVD